AVVCFTIVSPAPHLPHRAIPPSSERVAGVAERRDGSARIARIRAVSSGVMIASQSPGPRISRPSTGSDRRSGAEARCPEIRAEARTLRTVYGYEIPAVPLPA